MRGFRRYGRGFGRRGGGSIQSMVWMIGLAILFLWGHWWPGILVLVGISMLVSSLWREDQSQDFPAPQPQPEFQPMPPLQPMVIPQPTPAPVNTAPRQDALPGNCPRCGAPVRPMEVKWNGSHAACSYCGSALPAVKN